MHDYITISDYISIKRCMAMHLVTITLNRLSRLFIIGLQRGIKRKTVPEQ